MKLHHLCGIVTLGLLTGCAATTAVPQGGNGTVQRDPVCSPVTADQELLLNLAQEMVTEGRPHAALANLEQLPVTIPEVRLRMARILRTLDAQRAQVLYRGLLNESCFEAAAHHGLGQIAATQNDYREASGHLRMASRLAPADQDIRNDLGVVYLHLRRLNEARFELLTALELAEDDTRAVENLLTLLLYQDDMQQASVLIERKALSPQQYEAAQLRASRLHQEDQASGGVR